MFTGIIEEVGHIQALEPRQHGARLRILAPLVSADVAVGDSVAVNGVCLTAVEVSALGFAADASPETAGRSTLAELHVGSEVNLERALRPTSRLGGHIVQGHVDAVGHLVALEHSGDGNWWLTFRAPAELDRYLVFKGSVAVDGISLTIARLEGDRISAAVIPHTYASTNLKARRPGDRVNIETDILAKYVEKMLRTLDVKRSHMTVEDLLEQGF